MHPSTSQFLALVASFTLAQVAPFKDTYVPAIISFIPPSPGSQFSQEVVLDSTPSYLCKLLPSLPSFPTICPHSFLFRQHRIHLQHRIHQLRRKSQLPPPNHRPGLHTRRTRTQPLGSRPSISCYLDHLYESEETSAKEASRS
jgi:hypothetical protein